MTSPAARGREAVLAYSGGTLDRASNQRADPGFLDATLAAAGSRLIPMWRDQCIVSGEAAVPADGGVPGHRSRRYGHRRRTGSASARWFTRAELLEHAAAGGHLGRPDSIDRYLLHSWLAESA